MKKILIMCSIVLSGFAFAQDSTENPFVYESSDNFQEEDYPGNPGDPDTVSINDHIPALFIVAIVFSFAYAKRKKIAEN